MKIISTILICLAAGVAILIGVGYGNSPVKTVCGLLWVLLLINLFCPYSIVLYFLFMALSLVAFFIGLFGFILNLGKQ